MRNWDVFPIAFKGKGNVGNPKDIDPQAREYKSFRQKSSNKGRACVHYNKRNANITSIMRGQFFVLATFFTRLSSLFQSPTAPWLSPERHLTLLTPLDVIRNRVIIETTAKTRAASRSSFGE